MTKIVNSLLAFAASSSVLLAQGGWTATPGMGVAFDGGDAYGLNLTNWLKTQWTYTGGDVATDTSSFGVRAARARITGHVFKRGIRYRFIVDGTDDGLNGRAGALKDALAFWDFIDGDNGTVTLRVGEGKTLFGLEATSELYGLFFVDRSNAARGFSTGRSSGAWVQGAHMDNRLRWVAGAFNGTTAGGSTGNFDAGQEAPNTDNELSYVFGVDFDIMSDTTGGGTREDWTMGDFRTEDRELQATVGAAIAIENGRAVTATDIDTTSININGAVSVEGFQVLGEVFLRTDDLDGAAADEEESMGWSVQGTYVLPQSGDSSIQWGFGVRVGMVESDVGDNAAVNFIGGLPGIGAVDGDATEISLVANAFYHGHSAKTQLEYTLQQVSPTGGTELDNHIVQVAFQLLF